MAFGKIIFNKKGRWHWCSSEFDIVLELKERDLEMEWFTAEIFYPDFPDYDTGMHKVEVKELLSKPDKLIPLIISPELREKIIRP